MVKSPSGRAATVAVLDYPGPSTPARTKSVLLDDERLACAYPLDTRLPCTTSLPEYAAAVAVGLRVPPAVIVAYCGAAPVARELARLFPVRPRLVMVNPLLLTADDGVLALASFLADDADAIGADDRRAAEAWLAEGADHDRALRGLTDRHLGRLEHQFGSPQPHLRPIAVQLATMQVQWVYHIAAAADRSGHDASADELHVVSAHQRCAPGCPARHEVLGETVEEIFSDRRLADIVIAAAGSGQDAHRRPGQGR